MREKVFGPSPLLFGGYLLSDALLPENVQEVMSSETFDVLAFVNGTTNPEDDVKIYTDAKSVYRLAQLADLEAAAMDGINDDFSLADEIEWVDPEEVEALKAKAEESAIIFELRGLAPAAKRAIRQNLVAKFNYKENSEEDQTPFFEALTHKLIADTIVGTVRVKDGAKDNRTWTPEDVAGLNNTLHEQEFLRLDQAVYAVNYSAEIFDRAVSADFLSKR